MKKQFYLLATSALLTTLVLSGCSSPAEKVVDAQSNVIDANQDLKNANQEYMVEVENYKTESAAKIAANEKSITDFKARIDLEKKEAQDNYKAQIAMLEMKNSDMKKKMDDYKADGKDKWEAFKIEFSRDMNELGKAFKDLTVKNVPQ